jgi:hypothetical protein
VGKIREQKNPSRGTSKNYKKMEKSIKTNAKEKEIQAPKPPAKKRGQKNLRKNRHWQWLTSELINSGKLITEQKKKKKGSIKKPKKKYKKTKKYKKKKLNGNNLMGEKKARKIGFKKEMEYSHIIKKKKNLAIKKVKCSGASKNARELH